MVNKNLEERPVILTIIGSLGDGGKERQLIVHMKSLQAQEKYSTVLAVMNPGGLREEEAAEFVDLFIKIPRKPDYDIFSSISALIKVVKQYNVKIIHSWGSGIWDVVSLIVAKWCRVPFLHNGIQSAPIRLRFSDQLTRVSAIFADVIVANSMAGLKAFKLENHRRAKVIYNGMDPERFSPYLSSNVEDNLCMVANFRVEKDHQTMIRALDCIRRSIPSVQLFLVGHDFGTLEAIQNMVNDLNLHEQVTFITDTLHPEPYIAKSKVGILATHGEGISNVLLEYMGLTKPIVVSNNGGNPEVVENGINGYLVAPGSADELCEKVVALIMDPDLARKMGMEGRRIFEEKFSVSQMENAFNEIYSELKKQD